MKIKIILIGLILSLIVLGCTSIEKLDTTTDKNMPGPEQSESLVNLTNMEEKYNELAEAYNVSLGANILKCDIVKDNRPQLLILDKNAPILETVYLVVGSGGFAGINYYYDMKGNLIATYEWDDMILPNEPEPPIEIDYDKCKTLKESKSIT